MDLSGLENDYSAQETVGGGREESEDDLNQDGDVSGKEGNCHLLKPPHHQV